MNKTRTGKKRKLAARFGFTKKAIVIAVVVLVLSFVLALLINSLRFKADATVFIPIPTPTGNQTQFNFSSYVTALSTFAVYLGGILATLMIIYAGFIYLTSSGDTSKLNSAKEILLGSILGFIMLIVIQQINSFIHLP